MIRDYAPTAQRWLRTCLTGLGMASTCLAWAQQGDASTTEPLVVLPAQVRLGIEKLKLPGNESMGLVEAAWRQNRSGPLALDVGLYVGGGAVAPRRWVAA